MKRLAKTLTWALLAFCITTLIGFFVTGDVVKGATMGVLCRSIKLPFFYVHDLAYDKMWRENANEGLLEPCFHI